MAATTLRVTALALLLGPIQACALHPATMARAAVVPVATTVAARDPKVLPEVRLSRIDTGKKTAAEWLVFQGGRWTGERELAYTALLIAHPEGTVLLDTGLGTQARQQFDGNGPLSRSLFDFEQTGSVKERLDLQAASPVNVDRIIVTHLHWDHASGVPDFPNAKVYTTQADLDYARGARRPQVIHEQLDGLDGRLRLIEFADGPYETFDSSFDFFGDGSVVVVPLPGHTPGSVGVFVNLRSETRYLFIGDLTWALDALRTLDERPWLVRLMVDSDRDATRTSIRKTHSLMQAQPDLVVIPSHDPNAWKSIPAYPDVTR